MDLVVIWVIFDKNSSWFTPWFWGGRGGFYGTLGKKNGKAAVQGLRLSKNASLNSEGLRLAENRNPLSNKGLRFFKNAAF